ncbi:DUF6639 family protein [Tropicimonas aquimaris]|uniref:DUF6639 family protein n=1 Tax=Tropicimonas aquimaris TaxID=914152 RepID=A0ABW3IZ75_9RHOB
MAIVDTNDELLQERVCEIVASAVPKLAECGLNLMSPVAISFSNKLDHSSGVHFGIYHLGKNRIELLDPKTFEQAFRRSETWTAVPLAEHFEAVVVHEFAHALVDQNAAIQRACIADDEYIAYAMQIESLSESTRSVLLAEVGASPPTSTQEINSLVLGFSPADFAVRSWLHFAEPENGCAFVEKIIQGEVTFFFLPE